MTAENFDMILDKMRHSKPYRVFTVELNGGERFEVDHPDAMVTRRGIAVFLGPGGVPQYFDHLSVNRFIDSPVAALTE